MGSKICSKCETPFTCSAPVSGCWCEQYSLTKETLKDLKDNYADCLCPACLAYMAEQQEAGRAGEIS